MSSSVYHYANMSEDIKEKFGLFLTKETRSQSDKPRILRLVFDHENLDWKTGEFSLADCNGIIISKDTGFFGTRQDTDDDQSFSGLRNILSLYQCSKSEKLSILHNVFASLMKLIPSNVINKFNICNGSTLDTITEKINALCTEIKLILKIEFLPKSEDNNESAKKSDTKSHSETSDIFTDLKNDFAANNDPYYKKYMSLKKKYDALRVTTKKQNELYEHKIERQQNEIDALKQEIKTQDENMEILRLALDSQTKIAEQNRLMYSPKSVHHDKEYLSIQELKLSDHEHEDHSSCPDSSLGGFDEMKHLVSKIEDLGSVNNGDQQQRFSFNESKENMIGIKQILTTFNSEYDKLDNIQQSDFKRIICSVNRLNERLAASNQKVMRLQHHVINMKRIKCIADYILKNWQDNIITMQNPDNFVNEPISFHQLFQYVSRYFSSNIQNLRNAFDSDCS